MIRWMLKEHPWTFVLFLSLYLLVGAGVISTWAYMATTAIQPEYSPQLLDEWLRYLKELWPLITA